MSACREGRSCSFPEAGTRAKRCEEAGFGEKENGELLSLAEGKFDVLITVDKNLKHKQNITNRRIAILVIRAASNDIDDIRPHFPEMLVALRSIKLGQIVEVGMHHQKGRSIRKRPDCPRFRPPVSLFMLESAAGS